MREGRRGAGGGWWKRWGWGNDKEKGKGKARRVNKKNERMIRRKTSRVREGRTMGETERGRDSLRGLEKVKEGRATGKREAENDR